MQIELESVTVSGEAAIDFINDDLNARFVAPAGYQFVGQPLRVAPTTEVEIAGAVQVSIEYDPLQNDHFDPASLRMVRIVGDQVELLNTVFNDLDHGVLSATYMASVNHGSNPFGIFVLVAALPAPEATEHDLES